MRRSWFVVALAFAFVTAEGFAQCEPASSYQGFHQERVGSVIASDGGEALFGHLVGYSSGMFARRGNDWWWRIALMGGTGSGPRNMGYDVAMQSGVAVLGDPSDYSLPGYSSSLGHGAAVIYERVGGSWTRVIDLYPPTPAPRGNFGVHVAVSGDGARVLVGARLFMELGEVHVYRRDPGGWVLEQTILGDDLASPAAIGYETAMVSGYLFVTTDDEVIVFSQQAGVWTEVGALAPGSLVTDSGFGEVLAGDGTRVVVGARRQPSGTETGVVFEYDISQPNWMTLPKLIVATPGSMATDFGRALDLEGSRLAVAASGTAFEYRPVGSGWLSFAQVFRPSFGTTSDFGESIALYDNGILVGDSGWDDDPFQYPHGTGGVHAFDFLDRGKPFQACGRGIGLEYGGSVQFEIVWPQHAGKSYFVLGSLAGTGPLAVGGIQLPLTPDAYMAGLPATAILGGFAGTLDANGRATVTWNLPSGLPLSLDGLTFYHAAVAYDATLLDASNAITTQTVRLF